MTTASKITPAGTPIPRPSLSGKPDGPCSALPAGAPAVALSFEADVLSLDSSTRLENFEVAAVDKVPIVVEIGIFEVASGS